MYETHHDILTPADDTVLWRYMDLGKLLALLCDQSLFMCRLDNFRDPWEAVYPKPVVDMLRKNWPHAEEIIDFTRKLKSAFFVNCWHAGDHESAALWDLYASRAGLAIKTTVRQLKSAVQWEAPFYIGQVKYLDYATDGLPGSFNALSPPFIKRKSFEHEREVRVLVWDMPYSGTDDERKLDWSQSRSSIALPADITALINSVHLSPDAPLWLLPYIKQLIDRFGLDDINVEKSKIYDAHVY